MEDSRFDLLTRTLVTRRTGLGLALAVLFGSANSDGSGVDAKKKPKKCKPKCAVCKQCKNGKCKPKPNGTGCGGGKTCTNGTCTGFPGGCGVGPACSDAQSCVGGVCTCTFGLTACGAECIDVTSNGNNCGSCGNVCGAGAFCFLGTCTSF